LCLQLDEALFSASHARVGCAALLRQYHRGDVQLPADNLASKYAARFDIVVRVDRGVTQKIHDDVAGNVDAAQDRRCGESFRL